MGISRGFEIYDEPVTKRRGAKETNEGALEWLASENVDGINASPNACSP